MKKANYIYGEVFIKTVKFLYGIKYYNMIFDNKIKKTYYIKVNGYSDQKGKTNIFNSFDGNNHLSDVNIKNYSFNKIKEGSKLYKALIKRIN